MKTPLAQIPSITVGKHTDTSLAEGNNGKGTDSTTTFVEIRTSHNKRDGSVESLCKFPPFGHPLGIQQVKRNDLLWSKPRV